MNVTIHKSDSNNSLFNPSFSENKQNRFTPYIINSQTDDIESWTDKKNGPTHLMARVMVGAINAIKHIANFFIKLANFIHTSLSDKREVKLPPQNEIKTKTPSFSDFFETDINETEKEVAQLDLEGLDFNESNPFTEMPSAASQAVTPVLFLDNKPFNSKTRSITRSQSTLSNSSASSIHSDQVPVTPFKKEPVSPTPAVTIKSPPKEVHVSRAKLNAPKIKTRAQTNGKTFVSTVQGRKAIKDAKAAKAAQTALAPNGKKQKKK